MRSLDPGLWLVGAGLLAIAVACGADNLQAPRPAEAPEQCRSFEELMPRFVRALDTGMTENLRTVIRDHLLAPEREGEPPPINDVLRAVFGTLTAFARLPPERDAPAGQSCAAVPPPLSQANPLCEMRRSMDILVHQGKGLDALKLTDPMVAGLLNYVIGRPPSSATPHYEVAKVVADMCGQNAVCQLSDGLDLVIGLVSFVETPEGKAALDRMEALVKNPAVDPFLSGDGTTYGGENGIVALGKVILQTTLGMEHPSDLDSLPIDQLPAALQPELRAILEDTKRLLDPQREPNVFRPLKRSLNCIQVQDPELHLVRMIYRLGLEAKLPEFGLTNLTAVMKGLRDTDERGTLLYLTKTVAKAVRDDEQAVDSAAKVCRTLFSTAVPPGQTRSNAENALPVVADLFAQGVAAEGICAIDTLVFGCAGGAQPACAAR